MLHKKHFSYIIGFVFVLQIKITSIYYYKILYMVQGVVTTSSPEGSQSRRTGAARGSWGCWPRCLPTPSMICSCRLHNFASRLVGRAGQYEAATRVSFAVRTPHARPEEMHANREGRVPPHSRPRRCERGRQVKLFYPDGAWATLVGPNKNYCIEKIPYLTPKKLDVPNLASKVEIFLI
jgi:hypothetical protein